jgi:hypothetical protein
VEGFEQLITTIQEETTSMTNLIEEATTNVIHRKTGGFRSRGRVHHHHQLSTKGENI